MVILVYGLFEHILDPVLAYPLQQHLAVMDSQSFVGMGLLVLGAFPPIMPHLINKCNCCKGKACKCDRKVRLHPFEERHNHPAGAS